MLYEFLLFSSCFLSGELLFRNLFRVFVDFRFSSLAFFRLDHLAKMSQPTATTNKNVSDEAGSGALEVKLHPLVIINISDHFTRAKIRDNALRVFGALLGVQEGRNVEVFNSFEIVVTDLDNQLVLDTQYMERKLEASSYSLFVLFSLCTVGEFSSDHSPFVFAYSEASVPHI